MNIELKHKIKHDKYVEHIFKSFDIQNQEESIVTIENNIKLDFEWNIGVIYGGSGSGKSTLLKTFGEIKDPIFNNEISLISNFDWMQPDKVTQLLSAIGLSSVPCWLRPHNTLSNGEQTRANIAYSIAKAKYGEIILIDEYTSVVDRDVAKAMSYALQKYIRKMNKKIILASCHFDIMEWLNPDWIYSPNKGQVERPDCLRLERPKIQLEIFRCRYEAWDIFKHHHYLSDGLNKVCKCFIISWHNKPVAFIAMIPLFHGHIKDSWRISRIVVLPDYQGLGLGSRICDYFASLYAATGLTLYIKTSNPALWKHFEKGKGWKKTVEINEKKLNSKLIQTLREANISGFRNAITKSFKWIGSKSTESTDIIKFKAEAYKDFSQSQTSLF